MDILSKINKQLKESERCRCVKVKGALGFLQSRAVQEGMFINQWNKVDQTKY